MININREKHLIGWIEDIDSQRKAQRALEEREAKYKRIFQTNTVGIQETDLQPVIDAVTQLKNSGIEDISVYLEENPEWVKQTLDSIQILDSNRAPG